MPRDTSRPRRAMLLTGLFSLCFSFFFFQAEDGIRDLIVTGVQTCALPILPGERIDLLLFTHGAPAEAVHGLQAAVVRTGDDIDDVAEVALHRARGAEAVERVDDEVRVAQPAVPIVPVAATARRFGNRRRHRRDDRPGILADVELQRDGG